MLPRWLQGSLSRFPGSQPPPQGQRHRKRKSALKFSLKRLFRVLDEFILVICLALIYCHE